MEPTPDLNGALLTLAITAITGLAGLLVWLFRVAPKYLERIIEARIGALEEKVDDNTTLTQQVQKQTNGERAQLINRVQTLTTVAQRYRAIVQYVNSTPAGRTILDAYMQRQRQTVHDTDFKALEARLLGEEEPRP